MKWKIVLSFLFLIVIGVAITQQVQTPNLHLNLPPAGTPGGAQAGSWNSQYNANFSAIDNYLSGNATIPVLKAQYNVTAPAFCIGPNCITSWASGGQGGGSPGGASGTLQGNNNGTFGGVPGSSADFSSGAVKLQNNSIQLSGDGYGGGQIIVTSGGLTPPNNCTVGSSTLTCSTGNGANTATVDPYSGDYAPAYVVTQGPVIFGASGCSVTSKVGGQTAGSFVAGATSCTVQIGFANVNANNGWSCSVWDVTTTADSLKETAYTTNSVTFSGTVALNDVITFGCLGF